MKLVFLVIIIIIISSVSENINRKSQLPKRRRSFSALVFAGANKNNNNSVSTENCRWLRGAKHQRRLCVRRKGLQAVLLKSRELAVDSCQKEFEYDQWNCKNFKAHSNKKIYRETALMTSFATSALLHTIATACARGDLPDICKCAVHVKPPYGAAWRWGGCSDNVKAATRFVKRFLQLNKAGDARTDLEKYNARLGLMVIAKNEEKICKCHGISNSCTHRTCWKRLKPYDVVPKILKIYYHSAIIVSTTKAPSEVDSHKWKLRYLHESPNFCHLTVGRPCKSRENCATLCCSRGTHPPIVKQKSFWCNCNMSSSIDVTCKVCSENKTVLICK
ncbi:unnamed protein product [Brassicogethes aeneus]|uniref:Protein Wnt n=1 Tax=Brassicogethes aeneus TaxID=1431903 RepID=A0A9P0FJZ9_BRAAE|nr:unnamed protein product [Brassicogethes aeneus]